MIWIRTKSNFLDGCGLFCAQMIVDSHIHLFPPEVSTDPVRWAKENGEWHWRELMCPEKGTSLQDWPDIDRLIADMDHAGVDKAILQGWYWQNPRSCEMHNRFYLDCLQRYPDRLHATACWHREVAPDPVAWLHKWLEQGFSGVGEMLPPVQGSSWLDEAWEGVCELLTGYGLPLMFHVTKPVGRDYPGKVSTPFSEIEAFLRKYPDQKVVLAHWGGLLPMYRLHPSFTRLLDNVYVDTAASPLLYKSEIFQIFPQVFPADRILFGSDYPLRIYGRKQQCAGMSRFVSETRTDLPETIQEGIMGLNAQQVYKLALHR